MTKSKRPIVRHLLALPTLLLVASFFFWSALDSSAAGDTYYVDSSIIDTNPASGTPDCTNYNPATFSCLGGSASAYKTIADVNAGSFQPGDEILFRGGLVWREALTVPSSGAEANPITFGSFGTGSNPVITAADVGGTGWTLYSGTTWQKTLATPTRVVLIDGQALTEGTGKDSLNNLEFKMDRAAGILYLRVDSGNPNGTAIEIGQRLYAIATNAKNHIVIDGIDVYGGMMVEMRGERSGNISVSQSDDVTIKNLVSSRAHNEGVFIQGSTNISVRNSTFRDIMAHIVGNAGDGVLVDSYAGVQSANISITDNNFIGFFGRWPLVLTDCNGAVVSGNTFNATSNIGIDIEIDSGTQDIQDITIDGNTFSMTRWPAGSPWGQSASAVSVNGKLGPINGITLSHNTIDGGERTGFGIDKATGVRILGNTFTNVSTGVYATNGAEVTLERNNITGTSSGYGIFTETPSAPVSVNAYNNIFQRGATVSVNIGSGTAATIQNNIVEGRVWIRPSSSAVIKNNVFSTSTAHIIKQGALASDYNIFFPDGASAFWNGVSTYYTFASWSAAFSVDMNSRAGDPLQVGAGSKPSPWFNPRMDSPAIDAGTTTPLHTATSTDFYGNPIYGTPDIGAIEYQPPYTIGTHNVPATGAIRLYADGKFRERIASTTASTSGLAVAPQGGWGSGDYRAYMDIEVNAWTPSSMRWTATSSIATTTVFTVGGLTPNSRYTVTVDGATSPSIIGANCSNSVCQANGAGALAFTYSGSWSTHSFEVTPNPTSGGGVCLNCGSGSSRSANSSADTTTTPSGTSSAETSGSSATSTTGGASASPPFRCAETAPVPEGLSGAGLVNLLVSLGIIPSGKAKTACDALTSAAAAPSAPASAVSSSFRFSVPLAKGMRSEEVRRLQQFLNTRGFALTTDGLGAPGNETDLFGILSFEAVKRFQAAYAAEILAPIGLTAPSGFFGLSSIKKANALLGL